MILPTPPALRRWVSGALLALALAAPMATAQTPGTPGAPPASPLNQDRPVPRSGASAVGVGVGVQVDLTRMFQLGRQWLQSESAPDYAPDRLLVSLDANSTLTPEALAAEAGLRVVEVAALDALGLTIAELKGAPETIPQALQQLRAAHPDLSIDRAPVWYAQDSAAPATALPGGNAVGRLYAAALLGVSQPQRLAHPVRVAILDGAVDPAIGLEVAEFKQARMSSGGDPGQHGTSVACLLACRERGKPGREFFGMAPGIVLLNAAVLDQDGKGRPQARALTVLRGLDWALRENAQILNISLGARPDAVTAQAFARARPRLAAIVAAAGNGGANGGLLYPAALPGVIAVAAVDARARPYRDGTRGSWIDIAAPGVEVWVPALAHPAGDYRSGTSFAAPFVTAWAAHRLAQERSVDDASVCSGARDVAPTGRDNQTGCGLLQWGW